MQQQPIDEYERMPMRAYRLEKQIVSCRGRRTKKETFVHLPLIQAELDEAAPLTQADRLALMRSPDLPDEVKQHMQARIEAARKLKFKGAQDG